MALIQDEPAEPQNEVRIVSKKKESTISVVKSQAKTAYQILLAELQRRFDDIRERMLEKFRMEFGPNMLKFKELIGQEVNLTSDPEVEELIQEVQKMAAQYRRLSTEADGFRTASNAVNAKMRDLGGRFHTVSIFERDNSGVHLNCYQLSMAFATMSTNGGNANKDGLAEILKGFVDAFKNLSNTVMEDALAATKNYYTRRYELDAARYKMELLNESPTISAFEKDKLKKDIEIKRGPYEEAKAALKSKVGLMKQYRSQLVYQQSKALHEALIRYHEANAKILRESLIQTETNYEKNQEEPSVLVSRSSEQA
ncbi:hypothetical protein L596_017783 [Steinernema carpocapsae]|uniref:AH domain-containing protein n=1 Tax=Steinernema carpocapsae TaxID=34508 RepID=A0A4U5N334_STECR|nr:hypothetical protein L596_017783 [Steinernema carpocapsae]